jgi:23S rRNA-/tRNA-specific pseudouridylate synthase
MHKIQERPVAVKGQVVVRPMMYLALSYDHRIVDGKEAVTHLLRSQPFGMASLVELRLETGRQHQIRIHMSEEGHPVLADKLYGRPMPRAPRLALHAFKLGFRHPVTTDDVRFEVPLPDDLERLKCQLIAQAEEKAAERAARAERISKPPQG